MTKKLKPYIMYAPDFMIPVIEAWVAYWAADNGKNKERSTSQALMAAVLDAHQKHVKKKRK